jgi:ubiquitin-activating enzyme E1
MGHEAQRRMMASKALLVGCSGLGLEIAKNCILAGINSLVIADPVAPTSYDLGGNCYLQASNLTEGRSRANICRDHLAELNPYVSVSEASEVTALVADQLIPLLDTGVACLVVTIPLPKDLLIALNQKCREVNASFIYTLSTGVFGQVFCDFGEAFVCADKDGNPPATSQIETIFQEGDNVVVKVLEDQGRHELESGDFVTFARLKGVKGSITSSGNKEYKVHVTGPFTFQIPGETVVDSDSQQGYITQVKRPITIAFETYEKRLQDPGEMMFSDFAKFDRPPLLHSAYQALEEARVETGDYPTPGDVVACTKVLEATKAISSEELTKAQERIVLQLASGAKAIISPMCAALGGIVGQEVLKACSGKFSPINGFFYLDADETLPDELLPLEEVAAENSRYDSQIAVFGKEMQKKLLDLNYFMIGAGAIGCEMLKNWALMGVGCGPEGHVHVTDMDRIEKSNLSRQFLFRNTDINEFKSTTAAKAAQVMNTDLKITAYQEKAAAETEHLFGDYRS